MATIKITEKEKGTLLERKVIKLEKGTYSLRVSDYEANSEGGITITFDVYDMELNVIKKEIDYFSEKRWLFVEEQFREQAGKNFESVKAMLEFFKTHDLIATYEDTNKYGTQFNYKA